MLAEWEDCVNGPCRPTQNQNSPLRAAADVSADASAAAAAGAVTEGM